jgi:D-alanyl-D-alanine carboxypeptidase
MRVKASLIVSIICITICSCTTGLPVEGQLQDVLDKGIAKYDVNGVSATVIFPDGEIWNGVSGISHDTVPIEPTMLFAIGSVTKNFVAALTLVLAEEGVLSLDDPLSMWLPSYPYVDGDITIRQLLNHTSGLYMFWDNQEIWDDLMADRTRYFTPEEVLEYIKEPEFEAGEGWRYSNTNYLLLAMIVNEATGSNLSTELNSRLYQPLGLSEFYLSQEESIPAHQAHVYGDNWDGPIRDVTLLPRTSHESITYGSSGIFTTSENLARWSHALFEGGVLEEQSLSEMLDFVEFSPVSNMRAYGLGVQEFRDSISFGEHAIGHAGGNIGTTTYMVYLPEHHVSIAVMINAFPNDGAQAITKGLIEVVLKDLDSFGITDLVKANPVYFLVAIAGIASWSTVIIIKARKRGPDPELLQEHGSSAVRRVSHAHQGN